MMTEAQRLKLAEAIRAEDSKPELGKKPQAGEWWRSNTEDENAFICGFDFEGDPVFQTDDICPARIDVMGCFLEEWHHEPLCDGFDWKPKPDEPAKVKLSDMDAIEALEMTVEFNTGAFSQEFVSEIKAVIAIAKRAIQPPAEQKPEWPEWPKWYVHRDQSVCWFRKIYKTGMCEQHFPTTHGIYAFGIDDEYFIKQGYWIEVTEAEALARVKQVKRICVSCGVNFAVPNMVACEKCWDYTVESVGVPAESPYDWVTQDRVCYRYGTDQFRWVDEDGIESQVWKGTITGQGGKHGDSDGNGYTLEVRCCRKDLPQVQLTPFQEKMKAIGERKKAESLMAQQYGEQPQVNSVAVRAWARFEGGRGYVFICDEPPVGANSKYLEVFGMEMLKIEAPQ